MMLMHDTQDSCTVLLSTTHFFSRLRSSVVATVELCVHCTILSSISSGSKIPGPRSKKMAAPYSCSMVFRVQASRSLRRAMSAGVRV